MLPEEQAESSALLLRARVGPVRLGRGRARQGAGVPLQGRPGRQDRHRRPPARRQGRRPDRRGARPAGGHAGGLAGPFPRLDDALDDSARFADEVRERSGGIPIGFKMSAQHIEDDIDAALDVGVDYVILDGRGGGTGAAPDDLPRHTSRCRRWPRWPGPGATSTWPARRDVTLVVTGGFRRRPGHGQGAGARRRRGRGRPTSAIQAIGCLGMRACHTNNCPVGHRHPEAAPARPAAGRRGGRAARPASSARSIELMQVLARACGHDSLSAVHPARPHQLESRHGRPRRRLVRRGGSRDERSSRRSWHRHRRAPRRGPGAHRGRRRPQRRADPLRRPARRARQPLPAPGRPARRGLDRERAGCAARGTATTTTRSPGTPPAGFSDAPRRLPGRGARRRRLRRAAGRRAAPRAPCPTCWSRRWSRWGVDTVFGMVGHSNLGLRRRAAPGRGARRAHASSASATRAPPRSPPAPTASSPAGRRRASRSPARARRTCSPACTTPSSTARRWSRSPGRCRRRCSAGARSRTSTCPRSSATSRCRRATVHAGSDHAELAALAVKHAIDGRGVAHLVLPDEVQDSSPRRRRAGSPGRPRSRPARSRPTATRSTRAAAADRATPGGR